MPLVHHASVGIEVKFRDFASLSRWVGNHVANTDGFRVASIDWALTSKRHKDLQRQARIRAVEDAVAMLVEESTDLLPVLVVGAPLVHGNRVLNAAVVIHRGRILGVAPKSYLPTYREFYERRWFAPGDDVRVTWTDSSGSSHTEIVTLANGPVA